MVFRSPLLPCLLFAVGFAAARSAARAEPAQPQSAITAGPEDLQRLNSDRRVVLRLNSLRRNLQESDARGIRTDLRALEASDPFLMVPGGQGHEFVPLFCRLLRLLQEHDQPLLQQLGQEQQAAAEVRLRSVAADPQPQALAELILRYPCAPAGFQAQVLMARRHLERGNTLAAVWWLVPTAGFGVPEPLQERARTTVDALLTELHAAGHDRTAGPAASAADTETGTDTDTETETGTAAPSAEDAAAAESPAGLTDWQYRIPTTPDIRRSLETMVDGAQQAQAAVWTAWEPLVRDRTVFVRTLRGVTALDLASGRTRWSHHLPGSLIESLEIPSRLLDRDLADPLTVFRQLERSPMTDRLLRDAVTGRLSTDGTRLYVLNTAGPGGSANAAPPGRLLRQAGAPEVRNELVALDLQTGRPQWYAGGEPAEERYRPALAGAWICGVPTVSPEGLYAVVEMEEALYLVCLDAGTGQLLWRRFLLHPDSPVGLDPVRQLSAATPTIAGGLVFSQSTTGWVTAVDSLSRRVLWAARCATAAGPVDGTGALRLSPAMKTPSRSLARSWRPQPIRVVGASLVICPHHDHQLLVLDALTGVIRMQRSGNAAVDVLHIDPEDRTAVLGGTQGLEMWSLQTGRTQWRTRLPDQSLPAGTAVVRETQLLVPTTSGQIVTVDRATGALKETRTVADAGLACGGLSAAPDGLLAWSPLGIRAIPDTPVKVGSAVTLDSAERLVDDGRRDAALAMLNELQPTYSEQRRYRRIRFRALSGLFREGRADSEQLLTDLASVAQSPRERAVVFRLRVEQRLAADDRDGALRLLRDVATLPGTVRSVTIPARDPVSGDVAATAPETAPETAASDSSLRISLATWAAARIRELLSQSSDDSGESAAPGIDDWPDDLLLEARHPALAEAALARAETRLESGRLDETTLRLLRCPLTVTAGGADLESGDGEIRNRLNELLQRAVRSELAGEESGDPDLRHPPAQLIRRIANEWPRRLSSEASAAVDQPPPVTPTAGETPTAIAASSDAAVRQRLSGMWEIWGARRFRLVPVSQSTSPQRPDPLLEIADTSDPLLSAYRWRIRQSPPMLIGCGIFADDDAAWAIPGEFLRGRRPDAGHDELLRAGSILLVASPESLTAVSIIEQRVLWSRTWRLSMQNYLQVLRPGPMAFTEFQSGIPQILIEDRRACRVCGISDDAVCVQSDDGILVLDLYSGDVRWELAETDAQTPVFATSELVVAESPPGRVVACRLSDGQPVSTALTPDDLRRTLTACGKSLITWNPIDRPDRPTVILDWRHVRDGASWSEVKVSDLESFQFIDRKTLVMLQRGNRFTEVDLADASGRTFRFPGRERDDGLETDSAEGSAPPRSLNGELPGAPAVVTGPREVLFRDAAHYYVIERDTDSSPAAVPVAGRSLVAALGRITAIDRDTGESQWTVSTRGTEYLLVDQPQLPLLMLVSLSPTEHAGAGRPGPRGAQISFRALAKSTGREVFAHRVSSRWSWPSLSVDLQASGTVDVTAFGSHVRFIPE